MRAARARRLRRGPGAEGCASCGPRSIASTSASGRARRRGPGASQSSSGSERAWLDDLALYVTLRESHSGWGWTTWPEARARSQPPQARRAARARRPSHPRGRVRAVDPATVSGTPRARGCSELGVELMGDLPFVVVRRERRRLVARLAVPASPVARGPARRLLRRRARLGPASLRLARHGGRRPRLDPRAYPPRRPPLRPVPPRSRGGLLSPVGEAQGRRATAAASIRRAGTPSASRGRRVLGAVARRAVARRPRRAAARDRRGPRRHSAVRARRRCASWACPATACCRGRRTTRRFRDPRSFPADSIVSWSTHDTAPIVSWWDELPEHDRAGARGARRRSARAWTSDRAPLALLGDLYRASSNLALASAQELLGLPDRINTPATVGDHELELAPAAAHRGPRGRPGRGRAPRGRAQSGRRLRALAGIIGGPPGRRMEIEPGTFHPLGATWDGRGVNFALFSEHATGVELCLFDEQGRETRVPVPVALALRVARLRSGRRARGSATAGASTARSPRSTATASTRASSSSIPYARAFDGEVDLARAGLRCPRDRRRRRAAIDRATTRAGMPQSVVVDRPLRLGRRSPAARSLARHGALRAPREGLHAAAPRVPAALRGTYLGLASDAGHRAPRVARRDDRRAHARARARSTSPPSPPRGMTNYWGYSTLGFFAPDRRFATRARRRGPRVQGDGAGASTRAGIEVVLDVVYNHYVRGRRDSGPRSAFAASTTASTTASTPAISRKYVDFTGCGNTLDATHPQVAQARHRQPALLGRPRCTSTASASISPPRSRAAPTATSTASARSSTSSTRIPCSRA